MAGASGGKRQVGGRRSRAGWLAVLALPIAVLLLIELSVRLLGIEPSGGPEAAVPAWLETGIVAKEGAWIQQLAASPRDFRNYYRTYLWDRHLFYRLRPDLELPLTDVTAPPEIRERTRWIFRTGPSGYNTPPFERRKPEGRVRIVALGDSSTFGWGVESQEAYPRVMESTLRARHPGRQLEVINLGVCGYSTLQGLELLRREALALRPDIVTLSYGSNDYSLVPEPFDEVLRRNSGWLGGLRALLHHSRAYEVYAGFLTAHVAVARGDASRQGGVLNVGPDRSRENIVAMVEAARAAGAKPVLVTNCVPGEMSWPLRTAAEGTGAPLLDTEAVLGDLVRRLQSGEMPEAVARYRALYPAAWVTSEPRLQVYLTDLCHPNALGQRAIGEALAGMVDPLLPADR